jgi:hypothetical protein
MSDTVLFITFVRGVAVAAVLFTGLVLFTHRYWVLSAVCFTLALVLEYL